MPKVYPPEHVDAGLMAMVITGRDSVRASAALKAEGIDIPARTLRDWVANRHARRFLDLEVAHGPEAEQRLIQSRRALLTRIEDGLHKGVDLTIQQLDNGEVKEPWKAIRDLAVVSGIENRDYLLLQDRPTEIRETRTVEELQRKAAQLLGIVDGTAEEVAEGETPAICPESPS